MIPEKTNEYSGFIDGGRNKLYACTYTPADTIKGSTIFFNPFGEEHKCTCPVVIDIARNLAKHSISSIRFDFSGTGESTGNHIDSTISSWTEDANQVVEWLQKTPQNSHDIFCGIRFGCFMAAKMAKLHKCKGLILIEPYITGETFVHELETRQQIQQTVDDKYLHFGGYQISPEFLQEIHPLNLETIIPQNIPVLLIRMAKSDKFPAKYHDLIELINNIPGSRVTAVPERPFWGLNNYNKSPQLTECITSFIEERL